MRRSAVIVVCLAMLAAGVVTVAKQKDKEREGEERGPMAAATFAGMSWRTIGPALTSGRIIDLAVDPRNRKHYYVAVASGGVWETVNAGTTWSPIFDEQGSYSIGCVTIDPNDPLVVWVGTGENNSQRSVSYGDGVYKSVDGGKTWENVGLAESEHIGRIVIDPRDSDIVYVAAQGPLWSAGGDRGLYKTVDGGRSWNRVLHVSDDTGVTDVVMDPRNPDVLLAASYQRRRRVWTLINGGPESALYKSTDAGKTWRELENGIPTEELGRIGLAVSPANPDVAYAIIEAAGEAGGFFRSTDAGESWEKRNDYDTRSAQYYQEIIADPKDVDRVYTMDTWMHVTEDGGKTFQRVPETAKHVDNHALWIDPDDTDYLLAGCDGGVYESFDRGATWEYKENLPVTQFYRVSVDNDVPFYNVYGGTQDNFTLGGPSRTTSRSGIVNSDWYVTKGGDGFETQVDPEDPNIVYSQSQYGGLVRFDRRSGEKALIKPQPSPGDEPLRWNWDSPLIISPHSHTRLYFAAQRVFRSDDRGNSWTPISGDLSKGLDRNAMQIMGKVWSVDAVAKNASTSHYGNVVALSESPLVEGLIYAGTDDGTIQVTEDGGKSWRGVESVRGVPPLSYVSRIEASLHDADTVYAAFDNHKSGDFRPYVLVSNDRGGSWTSIAGDLPERGTVYSLVEDHVNPGLLFAGTEFGVFFTVDRGQKWIQLDGGIPVIAVRDLAVQRRENDLVAGTFGRGFYVLDDYAPLRSVDPTTLEKETVLFPVRDAWAYVPRSPLGHRDNAYQGDSFYTAPNPPFGAVFTYYLKDELRTREKRRKEAEAKASEDGEPIRYPSWEELRVEDREEEPEVLLKVSDDEGNVVRVLRGPTGEGIHRIAWDLRYPASVPARLEEPSSSGRPPDPPRGPMVVPGAFTVSLATRVDGRESPTGGSESFQVIPLGTASLPAENRDALLAFQKKVARLQRAVLGAVEVAKETENRIALVKRALHDTPAADASLGREVRRIEAALRDLRAELTGDPVLRSRNEPTLPSIVERVQMIVGWQWSSTSAPTKTFEDAYEIAGTGFSDLLARLKGLVETDLRALEIEMEKAGAPWTPGRFPTWTKE